MNSFDFEEDFGFQNSRKRRKRPSPEKAPNLPKGRVIRITGEGSIVAYQNEEYLCTLKGTLKDQQSSFKNLIAVGDYVYFSILPKQAGTIVQVAPRSSYLSRTDISGKKEQLIAVNIDIAVICGSILQPPFKPSLIDRYLIAAKKGNLHPLIVINKIDFLDALPEKEKELFAAFLEVYQNQEEIPVLLVSTKTGEGILDLCSALKDQTSVFSGQSGVGKTSLLNRAFHLTLKTGALTQKTIKGAHTTTRAELLPLPEGGYCVDTPGIRSFGIWNLTVQDVVDHFQDIAEIAKGCKFVNCLHMKEPQCNVVAAIDAGIIPKIRYESYYTLLAEALSESDKKTWS